MLTLNSHNLISSTVVHVIHVVRVLWQTPTWK